MTPPSPPPSRDSGCSADGSAPAWCPICATLLGPDREEVKSAPISTEVAARGSSVGRGACMPARITGDPGADAIHLVAGEFLWMWNTPPVPPNLSLTAPKYTFLIRSCRSNEAHIIQGSTVT